MSQTPPPVASVIAQRLGFSSSVHGVALGAAALVAGPLLERLETLPTAALLALALALVLVGRFGGVGHRVPTEPGREVRRGLRRWITAGLAAAGVGYTGTAWEPRHEEVEYCAPATGSCETCRVVARVERIPGDWIELLECPGLGARMRGVAPPAPADAP